MRAQVLALLLNPMEEAAAPRNEFQQLPRTWRSLQSVKAPVHIRSTPAATCTRNARRGTGTRGTARRSRQAYACCNDALEIGFPYDMLTRATCNVTCCCTVMRRPLRQEPKLLPGATLENDNAERQHPPCTTETAQMHQSRSNGVVHGKDLPELQGPGRKSNRTRSLAT